MKKSKRRPKPPLPEKSTTLRASWRSAVDQLSTQPRLQSAASSGVSSGRRRPAKQSRQRGLRFVDHPFLVSVVHLLAHRRDVGAELLLAAAAQCVEVLHELLRRLSILGRLDDCL